MHVQKKNDELSTSVSKSVYYALVFTICGIIGGLFYSQYGITKETLDSLVELYGKPDSKIFEIELEATVAALLAGFIGLLAKRYGYDTKADGFFWEELPSMWRTLSGSYLALAVAFAIICPIAAKNTHDETAKKILLGQEYYLIPYAIISVLLVFVPTLACWLEPSFRNRRATKPNAAQPTPAQPTPAQPNAAQPNAAKPDTAQPDETQTDAAKPDTAQPGETQTDAAKPDTAQPDETQTDAAKPDTAQPGETQTDAAKPDTAQPGETQTDAAKSDTAQPGETQTDTAKLDAALRNDLTQYLHKTPS